jgi:predicted alpha/beta-fold hydrolase
MMTRNRDSRKASAPFPPFQPHPLLRGGHAQTIAGRYLPGSAARLPSTYHEIPLEDGDRLAVLESIPEGWRPGSPAVILVHGLAGCARSPYVARIGARFRDAGIRVIRMNLRGAGSGFGLARGIYHGGRTEDLRAVANWLTRRAAGSPLGLVGFSLGGNLVLKLAAEAESEPLEGLDCVIAANPPLDLAACCRHIQRPENRVYDRHFVRMLRRDVARLHHAFPDLGQLPEPIRSVYEFDERYTAPRNGFQGAADYYERSSAGPLLEKISIPGLIVHATDDPFIPPEPFAQLRLGPRLALELNCHGGHLGYVSRNRWGRDRRWLDARLAAWISTHWTLGEPDAADA